MRRRIGEGVIKGVEKLSDMMDAPFRGREVKLEDDLYLPASVREAIRTRPDAHIGKRELRELIRNPGFHDQAIYLMTKALDTRPDVQQRFLEDLLSIEERNPDNVPVTDDLLVSYLDELDEDDTVQAGKLAQVSRQGFYNWDDWYRERAQSWDEQFGKDGKQRTPVLAAYATIAGLRRFAEAFEGDERDLYIVVPGWTEDEENDYCGYKINFDADQMVERLPKNFRRPDGAVILDETTATGEGLAKLEKFWKSDGSEPDVMTSAIAHADGRKKRRKLESRSASVSQDTEV